MKTPFFIVAGAKGAVGTTIAAALADMKKNKDNTLPWLTTAHWVPAGIFKEMAFAGWDLSDKSMMQSLEIQGVLPPEKYRDHSRWLAAADIRQPPSRDLPLPEQVRLLKQDIQEFKASHPDNDPVFVNLLPACEVNDLGKYSRLDELYSEVESAYFPDLAYVLAAIQSSVPVVNFTSNDVECPLLVEEAIKADVPWCGRDGKTGQTYLKVVIASALKARNLLVDGWYSLNILGNDDGKNLADPRKASGKLANKTEFLDTILGYRVGDRYGRSTHKVSIDYYPPRGDCKEAWDVIDFTGIFGMPMSLRLNMQLRDSILAAPMVIDLAVWMTALQTGGRAGLVPELGFYFKKAVGSDPPISFQDQIDALHTLEKLCREGLENRKSTGEGKP
jgi:myo-inositol-1-phosphate synthase